MDLHKIILYICAIILVSLSVLSEGGKRPRGKKYPVKPLFGVGLGYRKIVSYKPVLVFQKHKHHKIRHHHGGWGWGGWGGHHGHGHGGHGHGGHGHHGGHGKGHGGGHGGWASSYQGHHDGWSRGGGGPGWGWDDEMSYDDPHESYGGWESSLTSQNWTGEAPSSHNNEDAVNHNPISTRPETHNNDNLSNHNTHNQGKQQPFNEAHLNENLNLHPHHRHNNDNNNRAVVESNSRNRNNNLKNQAPDQGQHHPLIHRDERFPTEHPYREDDRHFFVKGNAKKSREEMREERFTRNFHRQNHDDPFHNFHNSDFLRRRRHQKSKGSRRRDSIQDVLAGGSENFDVIYMNEKKDGGYREGIQKDSQEDEKVSVELNQNQNQKSSREFDVNPLRMEFITTPSSFFSTTAFPTFKEFRRKRISA